MNKNFLLFISLSFVLFACGQFRDVPDYADITKTLRNEIITEHFIFHFSDGDSVDAKRQEIFYDWLTKKLKLNLSDKVHYYKYVDGDQIYQLLDYKGNAATRFGRIHSIWPFDNHEIVHVLVGTNKGMPVTLFSEGIAVANQTNPAENDTLPRWGNTPIDKIAGKFYRESKIPQLDSLLEMNDFYRYNTNITYPVSGSFVKYIVNRKGLEPFYRLCEKSSWNDSADETKEIFFDIYNVELTELWNAWLKEISELHSESI